MDCFCGSTFKENRAKFWWQNALKMKPLPAMHLFRSGIFFFLNVNVCQILLSSILTFKLLTFFNFRHIFSRNKPGIPLGKFLPFYYLSCSLLNILFFPRPRKSAMNSRFDADSKKLIQLAQLFNTIEDI